MKLTEVLERQERLAKERTAALKKPRVAAVTPGKVAPADQSEAAHEVSPVATLGSEDIVKAMGAHPQLIYVDQIELDPDQPRQLTPPTAEEIAAFDPDLEEEGAGDKDGIRGLARSIYIHGLLSPLVVDRARGRFKLVAGERRYWAVRLLGWKQVPAVIWGLLSPVHRLALQVTENLQREDLSREGKKAVFLRLSEEMEGNVSEVCRLLGINRSTYYRTVGEEGVKVEKRISSGQLIRALAQMKERLPNMERSDQEKVYAAVSELQKWIRQELKGE
jgi:ParB/RepB/Spo0J family partition protein